jgi:hypothetical protein
MATHAFTSAALNYAPKVRVLAESLRRHCPDVTLHWIVVDRESSEAPLRSDDPEPLWCRSLPGCDDPSWLFCHDLVELSTAVKPIAARLLLDRDDCDRLVYLDPDIFIASPLDDLFAELDEASLLLTPHLLAPERDLEAVLDNELCALRHGVFNLGFLALRRCPETDRFLDWWGQRCRDLCTGDWRDGTFTDQKWMNFAPVFFPAARILRSSRFNVAPWNVGQRRVEGTFDTGFSVDGEALGFYHFSGFDDGAHDRMMRKNAPGNPSLEMLSSWYRRRTRFLSDSGTVPWGLASYEDGTAIRPLHRRLYRSRPDLRQAFPVPHAVATGSFCYRRWLSTSGPEEYPDLFAADTRSE